jgi:hypothetical protein
LASAAGAAFFAFNYPKFAQLGHMQLRFDLLQPIILGLLLSLLLLRERFSQLRVFLTCLGAVLAFAVLASTTFLNAWFLTLLVLVSLAIALLVRDLRLHLIWFFRHHWLTAITGLLLGSLALLPLMRLYLPVIAETGGWPWPEVLRGIPRPDQLIWMGTDNFAWGWFAAHWPDLDAANSAEMRIGYGAGATFAWAALLGFSVTLLTGKTSLISKNEHPRDCVGLIVAVLLIASFVTVLLGIRIGERSLWYVVYKLMPGGAGVRSVSRYVLCLSLPLAIGFAYALDRCLARPRSKITSLLVAGALIVVGGEQLALTRLYSANTAELFERSIADAINPGCHSFYLKPTRKHPLAAPELDINLVTEQTFDATSYLSANPDVAQNWKGSAWEHFAQFGRFENRNLRPETPETRGLADHYQLTASLAALAVGVPTVNGYSGKFPLGWDLMNVFGLNIAERVNNWSLRNLHGSSVCLFERDLDGSEIPSRTSYGFFN